VSFMSADAIKSTVEGLLGSLGASIDSIQISDGARTVVAVSSPESKLLIGPRGETLSAINMIARRLVEAKMRPEELSGSPNSDSSNFLIDINGYHEAKLEELRSNARLLAARARMFKHEVEMPPMSSYERLCIHEMFANDPEIETISTGEGKFRHIVLKYKIQ
jgi:spoIIIJ-associated protein